MLQLLNYLITKKKGIPSYEALDDRLKDVLDTDLPDMRKPIFDLKGFEKKDLMDVSGKLLIMHEEAYKWNASDKINPILDDIVGVGNREISFFPNAFNYLLYVFFGVVKSEQRIVCGV